jgi:hypothetical protein
MKWRGFDRWLKADHLQGYACEACAPAAWP